jgi:hypothetical protein
VRLSHIELEACRANPRGWARAKREAKGFMRIGYSGAIKLSINDFHKHGQLPESIQYLQALLTKLKLINPQRTVDAEYTLEGYAEWFASARPIVAASKARIELDLGNSIILGGEVSRIDVVVADDGYRGILLSDEDDPLWQDRLRMPLLQRAIAGRFERNESDVVVGIQRLDGSDLMTRSYSPRLIKEALLEARALAQTVSGLLATES